MAASCTPPRARRSRPVCRSRRTKECTPLTLVKTTQVNEPRAARARSTGAQSTGSRTATVESNSGTAPSSSSRFIIPAAWGRGRVTTTRLLNTGRRPHPDRGAAAAGCGAVRGGGGGRGPRLSARDGQPLQGGGNGALPAGRAPVDDGGRRVRGLAVVEEGSGDRAQSGDAHEEDE